jgi:hypothetical protein
MAIIGGTQFLERLQFFNGQRLFAQDLQTLDSFNREMRWLHNQSLHQPGVGSGYGVAGNKGDRQVVVTPGYAIDSCGREIVLTEQHVEPVPPVAGDAAGSPVFYDLTVSYPNDSDLVESQTRQGVCSPQGAVRLREAPNFCWIELGANLQPVDAQLKVEVQSNMRIVLARAQIKNCQLYQPLSTAQRRNARQSTRPHIACGSAGPDGLNWSVLSQTMEGDAVLYGLEVDIDTSSARFQTPPCYSAYVAGTRLFSQTLPGSASPSFFILDGWVNITDATASAFTLQLMMPNGIGNLPFNPSTFLELAQDQIDKALAVNLWTVVWLGVEP